MIKLIKKKKIRVKADKKNVNNAARIIQKGGLVVFPTETVYGLGADAFNNNAVCNIFEAKKRPSFDPLIIHIAHFHHLSRLCKSISPLAKKLIHHFWPGPLTIILEKKKSVPDVVTAGLPTVAVRMPSHHIAHSLILIAKTPIAAPSANKFNYITPTRADVIEKQLGSKVDMILDDGHTHIGLESTIISLVDKPTIMRYGGIPTEKIEQVIGKVDIVKPKAKITAPGQMKKHYSPHTPIAFLPKQLKPLNKKSGVLLFKKPISPEYKKIFKKVKILSPKGDLHEAAKNLFTYLYKLDESNLEKIYVEKVPAEGIGIAIMDRLKRAVH